MISSLTVPCLRAAFTWHPRLMMMMRWTMAISDASTHCILRGQEAVLDNLGVVKEQLQLLWALML